MFRDSLLEELLGLDFQVFKLDERRVGRLSTKPSEDLETFRVPALVHEPSRGLREEHDPDTEDDGREDLNGDGHEPSSSALGVASTADVVRP